MWVLQIVELQIIRSSSILVHFSVIFQPLVTSKSHILGTPSPPSPSPERGPRPQPPRLKSRPRVVVAAPAVATVVLGPGGQTEASEASWALRKPWVSNQI